ncbi:MAG: HtrA protease/chaperone protein [Myxococcaceae bacterium]|nr:HtrA protease/chaperone protein [Myxococcaceae bacterium]
MPLHSARKTFAPWLLASAVWLTGLPGAAQPPAAITQQGSFAPLVDRVKDVVVNVEVSAPAPQGGGGGDLFEQFFGQQRPRRGLGSGILIDADGWLVTNNHVVQGAKEIHVKLNDGRRFDAEVVGRDPLTDVALVRLKGRVQDLPYARMGDSDALRVGDWVIAIGSPFGLASSVSAGIVSARARNIEVGPYDDFLQTDAAINPGNSGGPLFNMAGEVVGMNTAMVGGGSGIGFAVPSNLIKGLLPQLKKEGVVTRGWLGVFVQDLNEDLATALKVPAEKGAVVSQVPPETPAARANLRPEDVIVAMNGEPVESAAWITKRIANIRPGTTVKLKLYREGRPMEIDVKVGTRPDMEGLARGRGEGAPRQEQGLKDQYGMTITNAPAVHGGTSGGALVLEVTPGSAAARAELEPGMVIVAVGATEVKSAEDLIAALRRVKSGNTVVLKIRVLQGEATFLRALVVP